MFLLIDLTSLLIDLTSFYIYRFFLFFKNQIWVIYFFSTQNVQIFPKKVWPDCQKTFQEQEARQMEDVCHYVKFGKLSLDMSVAK